MRASDRTREFFDLYTNRLLKFAGLETIEDVKVKKGPSPDKNGDDPTKKDPDTELSAVKTGKRVGAAGSWFQGPNQLVTWIDISAEAWAR